MSATTKQLLLVQEKMAVLAEAALSTFVSRNPHYNGAQWADVLEVLDDSDSNLDVVEPVIEVLWEEMTEEQRPYIRLVTLTLLYATQGAPTVEQVKSQIEVLV
jgi:hypothetical protein